MLFGLCLFVFAWAIISPVLVQVSCLNLLNGSTKAFRVCFYVVDNSFSWWLFNNITLLCSFLRPDGRKVMLGVHSLSEPEETKQIFDILELHNHQDFDPSNYDNDIALIKVSAYAMPLYYLNTQKQESMIVNQNSDIVGIIICGGFCSWIVHLTFPKRLKRWNFCVLEAQTPTPVTRSKQLAGDRLTTWGPDQINSKRWLSRWLAQIGADAATTLVESSPLTWYVHIKYAQTPVTNHIRMRTVVM